MKLSWNMLKIVIVWGIGIASMATSPYETRTAVNSICIISLCLYSLLYYALDITTFSFEPWLTFSVLILGLCGNAYLMFYMDITYDLGRILIQLALCVFAFQILAIYLFQLERFWKATDYLWVTVGTLALLGSGLHKIRAEALRKPDEAYAALMTHAREFVMSEIQSAIDITYVEPKPRMLSHRPVIYETITDDDRTLWRAQDEEYLKWLKQLLDNLAAKNLTWTASDLNQLLATEPKLNGRSSRPGRLSSASLARYFEGHENSREWIYKAKDPSDLERSWLKWSPIGLLLAIGLRLGKTSAEVKKLSQPKPSPTPTTP